jgi:hypothetical protein
MSRYLKFVWSFSTGHLSAGHRPSWLSVTPSLLFHPDTRDISSRNQPNYFPAPKKRFKSGTFFVSCRYSGRTWVSWFTWFRSDFCEYCEKAGSEKNVKNAEANVPEPTVFYVRRKRRKKIKHRKAWRVTQSWDDSDHKKYRLGTKASHVSGWKQRSARLNRAVWERKLHSVSFSFFE